jgi:hypothetical protein
MKVTIHPAADRGVSQLMVVGDVPATAMDELGPAKALGILFALGFAAAKTRGVVRLATIAAAVGAGAYLTRK